MAAARNRGQRVELTRIELLGGDVEKPQPNADLALNRSTSLAVCRSFPFRPIPPKPLPVCAVTAT
jgi:hypothetical protein